MGSGAQFEAMLKEIVGFERDLAIGDLAGGAAEDYPAYREQVGFIRALDRFAEWCAEVNVKLDER
jgi:hypothetical protein